MSRFNLRVVSVFAVAALAVSLLTGIGAPPASARAGIHYVSVASTTPNPNPNQIGEPYVANPSASEAAGQIVFRIFMSTDPGYPAREGDVTVRYTTSSGTADQGVDFTKTTGTATIKENQNHVDIVVPVNNEAFAEDNEFFNFVLSSPSNASIQDGEATGTIVNDDGTPPSLTINDVALPEGNGGVTPFIFTVTLGGPAAQQVVKVDYKTKDGSAVAPSDYTAKNGTLTFAVGELTKTVEVPVSGDLTVENDETFTVELSMARNAAIADASGQGTIQSDDLPKAQITTAPGRTGGPHVRIFSPDGIGNAGFQAYEPTFTGGIRVARGDFIGNDGVQEIITSPCCRVAGVNGTSSRPLVRVFTQQGQLLTQWFAYDQNFTGGVTIASGNVDPRQSSPGDEIITAPGPGGGPHVRVWRIGAAQPGQSLLPVFEITDAAFMAYDPAMSLGVNVAVGDVVPEGPNDPAGPREEIVTVPMAGGGPHVQVQGVAVVNNQPRPYQFGWMAYQCDAQGCFTGGLNVATGNLDTDNAYEIVTGVGPGGGPHVKSWNVTNGAGVARGLGFMAYDPAFGGGINVASGNTQGSSATPDEIITGAGVGGGPHVQQFDANGNNIFGFMAYDINFRGGVWVAFGGGE